MPSKTTSKDALKTFVKFELFLKLRNDFVHNKAKEPSFCERRFCSVSALLSHEGPIKIDCQVRTSVRNGFSENIKHFPTFEWFTNMLFQYNQFLFPWENTRTQFSMGHSQSFQTKFRSMKVFQLVRLSSEKHVFFLKLGVEMLNTAPLLNSP